MYTCCPLLGYTDFPSHNSVINKLQVGEIALLCGLTPQPGWPPVSGNKRTPPLEEKGKESGLPQESCGAGH